MADIFLLPPEAHCVWLHATISFIHPPRRVVCYAIFILTFDDVASYSPGPLCSPPPPTHTHTRCLSPWYLSLCFCLSVPQYLSAFLSSCLAFISAPPPSPPHPRPLLFGPPSFTLLLVFLSFRLIYIYINTHTYTHPRTHIHTSIKDARQN